MIKHSAKQEFL